MANFSETKVTGKKYRVLTDASNNKWKRISFWTAASDVELADGSTLQNFINNINSKITGILSDSDSTSTTTAPTSKLLHDQIASLKSSFQAGVDGIYNAIVAQGTTPASKSQGDVKTAIGTLATAKYNQGKSDVTLSASASGRTVTATASNGKTASASVAYAGSNGEVSVSTSGGSGNQSFDITDGWCTSVNVDRTGAYNQGVTDADNRANSSSTNYKSGYNAGYNAGKSAAVAKLSGIKVSADRGIAPKGDGAQGANGEGWITIDTSNYSSAWLGSCEISKTNSYVEATMTIQSNGGSVLFSLSTSGEGKKTGGNVRLNLSGVNSITIYIQTAIYDNAFKNSISYGEINSITFAA